MKKAVPKKEPIFKRAVLDILEVAGIIYLVLIILSLVFKDESLFMSSRVYILVFFILSVIVQYYRYQKVGTK